MVRYPPLLCTLTQTHLCRRHPFLQHFGRWLRDTPHKNKHERVLRYYRTSITPYEQWPFYANKAKTEMRHFCLKRYKTRYTPVKRDRFLKVQGVVGIQNLSGPVLRDTARLSQRYPPIARYGVFGVSTWPLGCDTPSPLF